MFGRKKIVIGKNYLYDVMNETDMADAATLVTVIRKKKKNKYMVMAVNNFKVFETDACFLYPYTNPKEASVIRCQYGTVEFSKNDIITLQEAVTVCNFAIEVLNTNPDCKISDLGPEDLRIKSIAQLIDSKNNFIDLQKKLLPYAQITEYKNMIKNIHDNKLDVSKIRDTVQKDRFREFQIKFTEVVEKYASKDISVNEFVCEACSTISYDFPLEKIYNKDGLLINKNYLIKRANELIETFDNGEIIFIIGMDEKGITVKPIYTDELDNFEDMMDFFNCLYPDLFDSDGYDNIKPAYLFGTLKVKKIEEDE